MEPETAHIVPVKVYIDIATARMEPEISHAEDVTTCIVDVCHKWRT